MGDKNELAIRAGIEGVEDVGKAADKALSPWERGAKTVGKELSGAFRQATSDIARTLTVANAISFGKAIDDARKYREEIGRLSARQGPVGVLRAEVTALGRQKLLSDSEIVTSTRGLDRITYQARGARAALGGLQDEALATGETLADKLPIGATIMNGLSVEGAKVGRELGRVRALADAFGTSGGLLAAEDRLQAISGLLSEIAPKTDADRAKLEAMAVGLGAKLGPEAGRRVTSAILGDVTKDRRGWERFAGMRRGELSNEDGSLNVEKSMQALERGQQKLKRMNVDAGTRQLIAANLFGGDYQAGAAFMGANFGDLRRAALSAQPSTKTAAEADAFRASEAGQAIARQQQLERGARGAAEGLLPVADAAQGFLGAHPVAGAVGLGVGANLAGAGASGLLSKMGEALGFGGRAVAEGGKAAGSAVAAGGAAAGASLRAGAAGSVAGGAAGSLLGKVGLAGAALAGGYALGSYADEKLGLSDELSGTRSEDFRYDKMADDAQLTKEQKASKAKRTADRADRAQKILAQFGAAGSDNPYVASAATLESKTLASGDAALQRLAAGASSGKVDVSGLGPESVAMIAKAVENAKIHLTIVNNSDSPVVANNQQGAGGVKN